VAAVAAAVAVRARESSAATSGAPTPPATVEDPGLEVTSGPAATSPITEAERPIPARPPAGQLGRFDGLGLDDGAVPEDTTVFDDVPAVARLDPALLAAVRRATTAAAADGVEMVVNSGWRSAAYQQRLLEEAVDDHGSREEAARWVATPETSAHVSGDAIDLGPSKAATWLARHGPAYGLCRVYRNEPWHFELRPEAPAHGCPRQYADPTEDPRMHAR
jgi:hypothetical protein